MNVPSDDKKYKQGDTITHDSDGLGRRSGTVVGIVGKAVVVEWSNRDRSVVPVGEVQKEKAKQ